jgi:hypothetical protein
VRAVGLVALLLLAGCSGLPHLAQYTSAAYATPAGFHYPDLGSLDGEVPGLQSNPGAFDAAQMPFPFTEGLNATAGYAAYIRSGGDFVASIAVEFTRPLRAAEIQRLEALCQSSSTLLVDGAVLVAVQWSDGAATQGRQLVDRIRSSTSAQNAC